MILLSLFLLPLSAIALSEECFEARKTCFDQWDERYKAVGGGDCKACREYIDCMSKARIKGVCPKDTVFAEEVHEASITCNLIERSHGPFIFRDLDKSHNKHLHGQSFDMLYEFVTEPKVTYDEASAFCSQAGGSLYTVKSKHEFTSLKVQLLDQDTHSKEFWIGLNDKAVEGQFRFEDGSKMRWDFFAPGQGVHDTGFFGVFRRRGEDCATMDMVGRGFVHGCQKKLPFMCQYRAITSKG